MFTREKINCWEENFLASYAMKAKHSKGRRYKEKPHPYRSAYQRDRDRIIHSAAFRRLEYKTQVFIYHEGDYYRTRLTHTLEVAQIARTISKALELNENLAEAISLAHDLGHTPFGHAGEDSLNELLRGQGGFDHNIQGLRVVDVLEERYPDFCGLNLSWETREGIIKHTTKYDNVGPYLKRYPDLLPEAQPSLEAQVVDKSDEIAYDSHDLDDGIKSGMLCVEDLKTNELWERVARDVKREYTNLKENIFIYQIIRRLINLLASDLIETTINHIKKKNIHSVKEVMTSPVRIVGYSNEMQELREQLRKFLYENLYCHWKVIKMFDKAKRFLKRLFYVYRNNPMALPPKFIKRIDQWGVERVICDYIAGMTDRYALEEYKKIFDPYEKI